MSDAMDRINKNGKTAINSFAEGDEQRMMLLGLKRFTKYEAYNTKDARRRIAKMMIDNNAYCFGWLKLVRDLLILSSHADPESNFSLAYNFCFIAGCHSHFTNKDPVKMR